MDWNCTLTEERLSEVLDGTLAASDAASFSAHAAGCKRCTELLANVGGLVKRVHELAPIEEPPFLVSRIIASTRGMAEGERGAKGWFAWLSAIWPGRLVMGAVTVAASVLIVIHAAGVLPRKIAFSPVSLYHLANRHAHLAYAHGVRFVNGMRVIYVIQSRLFSEPQPASEPAPQPSTQPGVAPDQRPPDSNARPKSQESTPVGRRRVKSNTELAMLVADGLQANAPNQISRSSL